MNSNNLKLISNFMLMLLLISFMSCKKPAGEGGTSSISGKIIVEDWNASFTIKNSTYPGYDEDIYIIYGNDVSYGDRIRATYDGRFEFKYLRKGDYRIYVYSNDNTLKSKSGDTVFVRTVTITDRKQKIEIDPIVIYK